MDEHQINNTIGGWILLPLSIFAIAERLRKYAQEDQLRLLAKLIEVFPNPSCRHKLLDLSSYLGFTHGQLFTRCKGQKLWGVEVVDEPEGRHLETNHVRFLSDDELAELEEESRMARLDAYMRRNRN